MSVTVYAPGVTVEVFDRPVVPPVDVPPPMPVVSTRKLDLTRMVCLTAQYQGWDRYVRSGECWHISKATGSIDFALTNIAAGGAYAGMAFAYPEYRLLFRANPGDAPLEVARCKPTAGTRRATFAYTIPGGVLPSGDIYTEIVAYDAAGAPVAAPTECLGTFWAILNLDGTANAKTSVIKQTSSFQWVHPEGATPSLPGQPGIYAWCRMALSMNEPQPMPLAPRILAPIPLGCPSTKLSRACVLPALDTDHLATYRTGYLPNGVPCAENLQAYYPEDAGLRVPQFPTPRLSSTDGERRIALLNPIIDVLHGHAGGSYCGDAWSKFQINVAGNKRTFIGLRHKRARYSGHDALPQFYVPPPDINDPNVEIVNEDKWDPSVPRAQRFPVASWAYAWDKRTLALDPSKPLLNFNGKLIQQHATNPIAFMPCALGRVLGIEFVGNADGFNVDASGNVTDPITGAPVNIFGLVKRIWVHVSGLGDPWGLVCENGVIAITDRKWHRISEYSADTPNTLIGHVLDNPNGARFGAVGSRLRFTYASNFTYNDVITGVAAKATRVDPIVAGEGLYTFVDTAGDRWYGFGSYAMAEVREVNRRTKQIVVVCRPFVGWEAKSWYVYCKRGSGTQDGVVGTTTWAETSTAAGGFGRPEFFLPVAGVAPDGTPLKNSKPWSWAAATLAKVMSGPGGRTEAAGYASAFDISEDRISCSSSQAGLDEWTLADPAVPLSDEPRSARGFAYWDSKQYDLLIRDTQYALPVGENADCDYWLQRSGL